MWDRHAAEGKVSLLAAERSASGLPSEAEIRRSNLTFVMALGGPAIVQVNGTKYELKGENDVLRFDATSNDSLPAADAAEELPQLDVQLLGLEGTIYVASIQC